MALRSSMIGIFVACLLTAAFGAESPRITDKVSAIEAAKGYLKGRCNADTPCTFRPQREGKQWRVWVQTTRRNAPNQAPHPYPGGTLILYFDAHGNLIRRLEAD